MEQKEEINFRPEQNEETRIQKNEERLRNLQDNFKSSNILIIGVPEGEEEEQEIENLFEQITKGELPQSGKRNRLSGSPGSSKRVPKKLDPSKHTPRHIIITSPKIKDKERILEAAREKGDSSLQRNSHGLSADFSKETLQAKRGWKEICQVRKARTYIQDCSIQQS